jgi:acetate---CoA ligase (ADP-forming)
VTSALPVLLNPKSIAVVGASPNRGRAKLVLENLRSAQYAGEVFAINPRYEDVLGYKCYPSIASLPEPADCVVALVGADAACDVLEQALKRGTKAAVVPSAGFGEGGHGSDRAVRLQKLAAEGMCICGPNCFGMISVKSGAAMYSGPISFPLLRGPVAIVSQSGGLGHNAFMPLMNHRRLGFSHVISCGNATATSVEDYIRYFVDDPDVEVIGAVVESLVKPELLFEAGQRARALRKTIVMFQPGRSAAGQATVHSHTGALVRDSKILSAHLHRAAIVQVESYETFVETVMLFALAPKDDKLGDDVIVVSGSGGGAAVAADALDAAGVRLAPLAPQTVEKVNAALPEFGSVNNPLDGTGSIYDDPAMLPKLMDAILSNPGNSAIACAVNASSKTPQMLSFAGIFADVARTSGRTVVAYQPSPLGGELESKLVETLNAGGVPLLLGIGDGMRALRYLQVRREFWKRDTALPPGPPRSGTTLPLSGAFMSMQKLLTAAGVPVVATEHVTSDKDAVAAARMLGMPVVVKAEAPDLLHKSDIGCVQLGCASDQQVADAYSHVVANAAKAGFGKAGALVQSMTSGVVEAYAGAICDPTFGPAIVFGLGGIFIEVLKDTVVEMAPLTHGDALRMIAAIKGAPLLHGARGRPPADVEALAALLVGLGRFAAENAGRFAALDLNPIIVKAKGEGAVVVDIALEAKA